MASDSQEQIKEAYYGVEIWDATGSYYVSVTDINIGLQHNRPTSSNITYNSKYPYHIHDGKASYFSGSCTAKFSDNSEEEDCPTDEIDKISQSGNAAIWEISFIKWLHNDLIKYLRIGKNYVIPVGILETVDVSIDEQYTLDDPWNLSVTFNWEQLQDMMISF